MFIRKGTSVPPPHHHRFRGSIWSVNLIKTFAYVVLLLLSYSFGRYTSTAPPPSISNITIQSADTPASISNNQTDHCIHPEVEHNHERNLPEPKPVLEQRAHNHEGEDVNVKSEDHNVFGPVCGAELPVPNVRQTIIDRVFAGISPWMQFPPPHATALLRARRVQGWGSTGAVFRNLVQKVRPKIIIEVGTFLGASALHMVELTRELGLSPETLIVCVDDFRGWPGFQNEAWSRSDDIKMVNGDVMLLYQFMQNVAQANATESVVFLPFSTGSGLQKLCEWGVLGDLVEVDAGHDFHSAWSDINRAFKILRPGGVLFGHDYNNRADNRGVRRAVDLFAKIKNFRVRVDGQHWVLQKIAPIDE